MDRRTCILSMLAASAWPGITYAQTFPDRPIRMMVGLSAGGGTDLLARALAELLGGRLKQQVVVENRTGAGGVIAAQGVARAPADGHTLLFGAPGPMVTFAATGVKLPFDPAADFLPIGPAGAIPMALVVPAHSPIRSISDLLAAARAKPGGLTYASTGAGSFTNLAMELVNQAAKIKIRHVPYKGQAVAMPDLITGRVDMMLDAVGTTAPQVKAGNLRFLAVLTKERLASYPDLPTIAEAGLPGLQVLLWFGVWAPAGTPPEVSALLSRELAAVTSSQAAKERFAQLDMVPMSSDSQEFSQFVRQERARWSKTIKDANIRVEQ